MKLEKAYKVIRKELLMKDEPIKAVALAKALGKKDEIAESMIDHLYNPEKYETLYKDDNCLDYEKIEPESFALDADKIYHRYAWVMEELRRQKPKTMVDLACYVGSLVLTLSNKGIEATGVDMTTIAIEAAKKRAKKLKLGAKFFNQNLFDHKGKYDAVISFEVIEHIADPKAFIDHLLSLTNPGGWCYITTPNGPYDDGRGNASNWNGKGLRGHVRAFTKASIAGLLEGKEFYINEMADKLLWIKFRNKEAKNVKTKN